MGIRGDIGADYHAALAALAWHIDLGADEALGEVPICAYDLPEKPPWGTRPAPIPSAAPIATPTAPAATAAATATASAVDADAALQQAQNLAQACHDLPTLEAAAAGFQGCELRLGARGAVPGLGHAQAALLILCDPPSIEAEKTAIPLLGPDLTLLQAIFAAIGLSVPAPADPAPNPAPDPARALHLAPVLPWPLRGGADQHALALRLMRPFTLRRIALIQPKCLVIMGHSAAAQLLPDQPMTRLRGKWHSVPGSDHVAYPMQMPATLLKSPQAKREAWADALAIKSALRQAAE